MAALVAINSAAQAEQLVKGKSAVLYFWASWAPMCKQTDDLAARLAKECPNVAWGSVEAEEVEDVTEKYDVQSVPAFVFVQEGKAPEIVIGANAPEITQKAVTLNSTPTKKPTAQPGDAMDLDKKVNGAGTKDGDDLNTRLKSLINKAPVMLFMKGEPGAERCGFSRTIVGLLKDQGVPFGHFDILGDEEVRQGLKTFSNWPTFPQLYAKGKLIGGVDIVKELIEEDELKSELGVSESSLDDRLKKLTSQEPVMLFMKGEPGAERCGFSRTIVGLLKEQGVQFGHFDILGDEEVRQGLKTFSNWPTFPQLYAKGKLIGGVDIVKELIEEDELKESLGL
eukprot:CAMPEP_0184315220 /NCGR_PEP_ID=MMETSP1049-20130417/80777_1 /TAXON_ID=77928 /ORGANISM="Proteomonas sulcata, Strain CCMP704" /LENGTH=337 /DNA_ID=CAMNT_0026633563 /DNA_START=215 /DNA_END=1228 /DNA_ORIENTATION=+